MTDVRPKIAITADRGRLDDPDYLRTYKQAVEAAGGEPVFITAGDGNADLEGFDGLMLPGGPDVDPSEYGGREHASVYKAPPELDALELGAARAAKRDGIPTLAICRGCQVMNVALGGTLFEDISTHYEADNGLKLRHQQTPDHGRQEPTHPVDVAAGSVVREIVGAGTIATNSMHHQALRRIPYDLTAVARARDGVIEAIEARDRHSFYVGVQWHPECMVDNDEPSRALFRAFVKEAAVRARQRAKSPA